MTDDNLKGIIPAVPTPVSDNGAVDIGRFLDFCRYLFDKGANGLNITGTTGEATSLSRDQRLDVIAALAASNLDKSRIIVGTGAAAVADAVALAHAVADAGFAGALVLPPFYFKDPSNEGLRRYFEAILSKAPGLDIYLYNFPALSGIKFTKELVALLVDSFGDRIKGLKDSSGDLDYAAEIVKTFPGLKVFPSSEAILLQAREGTFAGSISATANLSVGECAAAFRDGDGAALDRAVKVRQLIAKGPLVPRIKAVISGRLSDPVWANTLPPYAPLDRADARTLVGQVDDIMTGQ